MPSHWSELLLLASALTFGLPLAAQQGSEAGVLAIGTASDPAVAVLALYGAVRTSTRSRLSLSAGAGASAGEAAFRGEILGHFLLSPGKRKGAGFYLAGGVAAAAGPVDRGYLVLTFGIEDRPGAGAGWAVEAGVGGGARLALGYRWRWLGSAVPR
ncbi:MAG TPA: hypothetical protein VJ808_02225 [Gemmatimonadales bacterium]|nr:hypothetical protein [Gemmatimonadales bacterium]